MKRRIIVISIILALAGRAIFADEFMFSEYSPDKQYRVEVYIKRNFFSISMPGQGGLSNRGVVVVLKNKWGLIIGKSSGECNVLYDSVEIEWDYDSNLVWFAKAHTIDLITGKCDC